MKPQRDLLDGLDSAPRVGDAEIAAARRDPRWRREALLELDRRAIGGIYIYTPCWLAVAFQSGVAGVAPWLVLCVTLLLGTVAAIRLVLHRAFGRWLDRYPVAVPRVVYALIYTNCLTVCGLAVAGSYWPPLAPAVQGLWLLGGVTCAAATLSMSFDDMIRRGVPLAMLGPVLLAALADPTRADLANVVFVVLFGVYLHLGSSHAHRDYWRAVASASLLEQRARDLERLSMTDPLTQIANRRYFEQQLMAEWSRASRVGGPLAVLLVDLDHFKRINDRYGHPVGDQCLVETASALSRAAYRDMDTVARFGGEEFVVLLPGCDSEAARVVAERLRMEVAALRVQAAGDAIPMTCSIGYAMAVPATGTSTRADLLARADAALYQAKADGRNRAVSADPLPEDPAPPPGRPAWRNSSIWSVTLPG